jgi:hypothetical protein
LHSFPPTTVIFFESYLSSSITYWPRQINPFLCVGDDYFPI